MKDPFREESAIGHLSIHRYEGGTLRPLVDSLGRESTLTVNLPEGKKITVPCTPLHLRELEAGILFSQSDFSSSPTSSSDLQPLIYEKIMASQRDFSEKSSIFKATGSVHSGQLLDKYYHPIFFTEDMSRHNVLDKLIGYGCLNQLDMSQVFLLMSSRMPLELVLKAYHAGITAIISISAPTLEAVEFARRKNMILIGMFRGKRFNLYSPVEKE